MRLQPLLTAEESRRAEEAHQGAMEELMERAGAAVAELVLRQFPGSVLLVMNEQAAECVVLLAGDFAGVIKIGEHVGKDPGAAE